MFTAPGLGHEFITFDYDKLLKFIFKICKLYVLASELEGIEIVLTLDGVKLTNNLSHVTCSVKIIDVRARDAGTNVLVFDFQGRDHYFVFESHTIKDSKDAYKHFKGF